MRIFGLILAGGSGVRMGGVVKAGVTLAGSPLLAHVAARLGPQVSQLAVSFNGDRAALGAEWMAGDHPVLPDRPEYRGHGPLAGVQAGLDWAVVQGADVLVTAAVDTPFLPMELVTRLSQARLAAGGAAAVACSGGRKHPTFALWQADQSTLDRVSDALIAGERRLGRVLGQAALVEFTDEPDPFFNINTPADLHLAQHRAAESGPMRHHPQ
ncbi:molybdenum cofactor guanylyltransferase [Rhodobacteraceae bacterium]|nr:molybdenum cofactor guanylyltransferase [Paracoccaceae bacterium]